MHFWEIFKLQFEKERHTLLCILKLFTNIIHELSLKNACHLLSQYIARECEASYNSCHVIRPGLRRSVKTAQESQNTLFNAFLKALKKISGGVKKQVYFQEILIAEGSFFP